MPPWWGVDCYVCHRGRGSVSRLAILHAFVRLLKSQRLQLRDPELAVVDAVEQGENVEEPCLPPPVVRAVRQGPRSGFRFRFGFGLGFGVGRCVGVGLVLYASA